MATPCNQFRQCLQPPPMTMDRRWKANIEPAPGCPRCASPNTKFCYYNNYSLSQPRYFCKGCRRYWTKGGSLRNVPVGGGCRKTRRSRSNKRSASLGGVMGPSCSSDPTPSLYSGTDQESGGHEIDMAAVFARFLSSDQENANEINEATNTPSEASHDTWTSSPQESQMLTDATIDQEFLAIEGTNSSHHIPLEEQATQEFISPDLVPFDNVIDDMFWSYDSNLSSLTLQAVSQFHDFDSSLPPVDQPEISTDLFSSASWNCFDTATLEAFSRH